MQCGHAVQSTFWVTDPDRTLWELYVFHHDVDDDAPAAAAPKAARPPSTAPASWAHRMGEPVPSRIPFDDNHLDQIALNGTFNMPGADAAMDGILAEAFRTLKPGGILRMHVLTGDRPSPSAHPRLPGPAVVAHVPYESAPLAAFSAPASCARTSTRSLRSPASWSARCACARPDCRRSSPATAPPPPPTRRSTSPPGRGARRLRQRLPARAAGGAQHPRLAAPRE